MEIKKENKLKKFFKRFGTLGLAGVMSIAIALTIAFAVPREGGEPVSNGISNFGLPMTNAVVIKDFKNDRLQHNESLQRWEIHLSVDLSSEKPEVFSVYDGVVDSITTNSLEGTVIKINHEGGFVSVYASLSDDVKVKEGDKVNKGQEIGKASASATNESKSGEHLHFTLLKDGKAVDPNNYLDLQNK